MKLLDIRLHQTFCDSLLSLSIHRLWEHLYLYQSNPFKVVTAKRSSSPKHYVDVVYQSSVKRIITGITLEGLLQGKYGDIPHADIDQLLNQLKVADIRQWLKNIEKHMYEFSQKKLMRNVPAPFLLSDINQPLGIHGLHCALNSWSLHQGKDKATIEQWQKRISNLVKKGMRADELEMSCLAKNIIKYGDNNNNNNNTKLLGYQVATEYLTYSSLRLNIIPVIKKSENHLNFIGVSPDTLIKRIMPKIKGDFEVIPYWRDQVLGYWIYAIQWKDLIDKKLLWMAFTHRGEAIESEDYPTGLCDSADMAKKLAYQHASRIYPKMTTMGSWSEYRLTGGKDYREWLVTLPDFGESYYSEHFKQRNVLLHVRCDIRENFNGDKILFMQEIQSDWAQQSRNESFPESSPDDDESIPSPPWLKEWPSLGLKLMLLHAVRLGINGFAWTPGDVQMERYKNYARDGLKRLYDQTLPAELNKILRPYGKKCEVLDVYQPKNFYVEPIDMGYEVLDANECSLGKADTWQEAQALIPNGGHEQLMAMPGIQIDNILRQNILKNGFYAWGNEIR